MAKGTNSISKTAVWILLGLLILGLGGFGATNLSGTIRTVGSVGDKHIDIDTYARTLQREIQSASQQRGSQMTFAEARAVGLDQSVLSQLVRLRALDHEAEQMGLSVGDVTLRDEILNIPSFQGLDGSFDRDAYRFALEQSGSSEAEFETQLREEVARSLLQAAIISGISMPDTYARTLVSFLGETRDFTWARLDESNLVIPLSEIDEAGLRAWFDENIANYQLPETKRITYAALLPETVVQSTEIDEQTLRAEYEARVSEFNTPERRLIERLVYIDTEAAERAAAQLEVGGTTFETLVQDRGLNLADVDLGDVSRLELDAAGEAVFGADVGVVVGPLPSSLGPALFRVNGVLPAQSIPFEEASVQLRDRLAQDSARREIAVLADEFDDMLAAGATLEELDRETDMILGTIDWFPAMGEGIAAYDGFRQAAAALNADDFPEITALDDGGIFAMRLDDTLPARPAAFEDVRDRVQADWQARQTETALSAQAQAALPALEAGDPFADHALEANEETQMERNALIDGTPPTFMPSVFEMAQGEVRIIASFGAVLVVRLDAINKVADDDPAMAEVEQLSDEVGQRVATDLFNLFGEDVVLRAGPQINQQALDAVHVNFP